MTTATPERITKRELTVAEAAEQWVEADRQIEHYRALRDEAAPIVKAYLKTRGRTSYKKLIELVTTPPRTILDQDKVKAYLGAKLKDFQTRSRPSEKLVRLQK